MPISTTDRFVPQRQAHDVNVSPTLFIGLGGSGKEVLMRLRRLFYTNMRQIGLPICEYLWIDTDPRVQNIMGQDYDVISSKLYLPNTDIIDAQVSGNELTEYYDNPTKYGHIFEWLHQSLRNLGPNAIQYGTGMVRPCGRLAFWNHYPKIRSVIERKLEGINNSNRINLAQDIGFNVDVGTKNVFLVASIAGGTGAGMLLDTAFLLKSIDKSLRITGVFFLPSVFTKVIRKISEEIKQKIYANGYAALMELDHFMSPKVGLNLMTKDVYEKFDFKWGAKEESVEAGPLHTIYLIGRNNRSGNQLSEGTEVFQMAAEAIHLEFCQSGFAGKKRSVRVNFQDFYINESRYEASEPGGNTIFCQYFPRRYSSFGLSLIKLDVDRRRNAAAHYFARSLVEHWRNSFDNTDGIRKEVDEALAVPNEPGKKWGHDEIRDAFLKIPETGKSMLSLHQEKILEEFKNTKEKIEEKFLQKTGAGAVNLSQGELGDLNKEIKKERDISLWDVAVPEGQKGLKTIPIKVLLKKVSEDWNSRIEIALEALDSTTGPDMKRITENADSCLKRMQTAFLNKFHELLTKPGDSQGKAGIRHAAEFCKIYSRRLNEIEQKFVKIAHPSRECNFALSPFEESDELKRIMAYRAEGLALRAPYFRKTAVSWYDQALEAKLKAQLDGFRDYLLQEVEGKKKELLRWYEVSYYNHVCTAARQIFKNLAEKIESCQENLNLYEEGLKEVAKNQEELFDAFNRDYQDIRHHSVEISFDDQWFKTKVAKALAEYYTASGAMPWETLLEEETLAFFFRLLKIPEAKRATIPKAQLKSEGFEHLFQAVCERSSKVEMWKNLLNGIETYCFARMGNFLGDTNVDSEFQRTEAKERQQKLGRICSAADVWITPSTAPCKLQEEDYIGVPSLQHIATADQAMAQFSQFNGAELFEHEKGNMVFYKEIVAFPLFHLKEVWECRKHYAEMADDLNSLYQRHLDYRKIPDLRDVAPPENEQEAISLFNAGLIFIESLILGCCLVDPTEKIPWIRIKMPRNAKTEEAPLGITFGQIFRILSNSPEDRQLLKDKIDQQKTKLKKAGRNPVSEELALAEYYTKKVFPPLQRAGRKKDTFHTNFSLVCSELWERLKNEMVNLGAFTGPEDPELWDTVDKVDLEAVSIVFPFREEGAQAELRVLKVS